MDTRPISAVMALAAYQLPVAREYAPGLGFAAIAPMARPDSVEISAEARAAAAREENLQLWGEVRYDYPHTDDPDLPWEVAAQEWEELMARVFPEKDAEAA
jgi:hypothetical protein